MFTKSLGTTGRGAAGLLAGGGLAGALIVFGAILGYGVGAGYVVSVPTPWNVVATIAIAGAAMWLAWRLVWMSWHGAASRDRTRDARGKERSASASTGR